MVFVLAGFLFLRVAAAQAEMASNQAETLRELHENNLSIHSTQRISIPYGFDTPLPVIDAGRKVVVSGHGGCTAGEQVTVAITVTQASGGAVATGQKEQVCSGELQTWSGIATAVSSSSFANGPAESCGLATTRDNGYVTDTFAWCKDVDLVALTQEIYLPAVLHP